MEICNGAGITVQFVKNVIIHHNIPTKGGKIKDGENHHGLRGASDGDGVSLFRDTNISFDHLSHHHCADGLIDAIQGSTEKKRKKLANCAPGFARGTTGRKDGEFYMVTDPIDNAADPKPGTLRHAVTQNGPLWITFKVSMTIKLQQELIVTKDHIAEYDDFWKARELEAIENLDKAYHSNPEEVVRHYNDHFSRTMLEFYITKRV
ncbi:hypothetical protein Godav_009948 [Gossypium davidsonii]|uniref:Pectate lyase N-terminal domain-containing protein n=1 Tax=Gossypium davidsonii TaxID=34287 RepID=A0A7J8SEX6_GOSDV|nr:hypothetical protein [Gossypium davidsonii]